MNAAHLLKQYGYMTHHTVTSNMCTELKELHDAA
jgi:hypothetical protein